jgi:hypothetical protein
MVSVSTSTRIFSAPGIHLSNRHVRPVLKPNVHYRRGFLHRNGHGPWSLLLHNALAQEIHRLQPSQVIGFSTTDQAYAPSSADQYLAQATATFGNALVRSGMSWQPSRSRVQGHHRGVKRSLTPRMTEVTLQIPGFVPQGDTFMGFTVSSEHFRSSYMSTLQSRGTNR